MDDGARQPQDDPVIEGELVVAAVPALALAGAAADHAAATSVFAAFQARKAPHTRRRHQADLGCFRTYLAAAGVATGELYHEPLAWQGITWGLVAGFVQWQLGQGYAIGSVNVRLATVKTYCQLALHAGTLDHDAYIRIKAVKGYSHSEGRHVDQARATTRTGRKKATAVSLTVAQARQLKRQPSDTPQGRRDALLLCLLLDHGLRVSEIAGLRVEQFNLAEGTLTFYRPKVDLVQTHALTSDTLRAALIYINNEALTSGPLLPGSRKTRHLSKEKMKGGKPKARPQPEDNANAPLPSVGMTTGALNKRVGFLGAQIGLHGLSPHDCRHYWATSATRGGTDLKSLQDAGGWKSPAMPLRYVESQVIANQGVKLADR
ncbi:MAG: site-specific integrase [Chloroflexota bacterium]|nr:site-specific integrase [Chloroflexota bacterium]